MHANDGGKSSGRSGQKLILASGSPQRKELLQAAGYRFEVVRPSDLAECGVCSRETPPELVARLAFQKGTDVASRVSEGVVVACDTVAECVGQVLGKPRNREHARQMLTLLSGREHHVYSGLCVWLRPGGGPHVKVDITTLYMEPLGEARLEEYLDSGLWQEKAGAFGYQDRAGWLSIRQGSESNVIGLPMELLATMLAEVDGGQRGR